MNWLKRLFGESKTSSPESASSDTLGGGLAETVQAHLNRLRRDMTDAKMTRILDEVSERFLESALAIEAMVAQTASDGKLHTKAIGGGGAKTWLIVSAVPRNRQRSADFFASEYPPGYGGYVNFWLNSSAAQSASTMGHSVMAQLLVYADRSVGLGLCSLDMSNPLGACPKWVFPEESMTKEDRRLMGMRQ
jgi:hypothetical protein